MSEVTPGRRWLGRGLLATAATLALPLTASISYSVAQAQEPTAPPVPAEAPLPPVAIDPDAPETPEAPEAVEGEQREVRTVVLRHDGPDGQPQVRQFTFQSPGPNPPMPAMPRLEFHPDDPEFERRMEEWGEQMEKWGEEYGKQWEQWAEQHGEEYGAQALAWSEQARRAAPEVVHSCDVDEPRVTADGRTRVIICQREIERMAHVGAQAGLRGARAAIASNQAIDEDVRREILQDLDEEIARIERESD